jgi:PhnB protein
MQVAPYLSFRGDCEEALTLYARCLGGRVGELFRYGGSPMEGDAPAGWSDKIMHGSVQIGDQTVMGADMAPAQYDEPKGFSLSVHLKSTADAERIFQELSSGGKVIMPLEKTFWAALFGMLVDRFGIPWSINCE